MLEGGLCDLLASRDASILSFVAFRFRLRLMDAPLLGGLHGCNLNNEHAALCEERRLFLFFFHGKKNRCEVTFRWKRWTSDRAASLTDPRVL